MKNVFFASLIILIFSSCSTEKDTRVNRFYHNTTAYYNGYFNAREIIKEQNKVFAKTSEEDYTKIIPVNHYPNEEESKSWFPEMDRAIEKTSKVIAKHAMPREKVGKYSKTEYGSWMDENWLVMGQSYFYKREYPQAIEKFEYVIKMYEKDPSKYEAKLWLAKTYIEMENFVEANKYLQEIVNEKEAGERKEDTKEARKKRRADYGRKTRRRKSSIKVVQERDKKKENLSIIVPFPEDLNEDLITTLADFHLRRGEYKECIEFLDSAINIADKKRDIVRYKFIKAQIHQELGEKGPAYENYSYVIKKNASYRMAFYAKINRAMLANSSDRKNLRKELLKLAKDEKYNEFKDQIYYALGELELQDKNKDKAIEYFQLSATYPSSNETQKGKTYIRLADLYFEDRDYMGAQRYYDSSLTALPNTYKEYDKIKEKSESLTLLVGYIKDVKLEDSLQAIASIKDEKKRLDRIEEILYQEKLRKEKEAQEKNQNNNTPPPTNVIADASSKGKFWMYNPQSKTFGYNEFKSTWGDIKLEDDWRRKNKNKSFAGNEENNNSDAPIIEDKEIKAFADKLPTTPEKLEASNTKIRNALYLSGLIYRDKLDDNTEAIKSFSEINKRFYPDSKIVPGLYQLYKTYKQVNRNDDADDIKRIIIDEYPQTEEAKILKDPSYANRKADAEQQNKKDYAAVYQMIEDGQNIEAISQINQLLSSEEPNPYSCKLRYLKAKAYGNLQQMDSLEKSLKEVVSICPDDPLAEISKEALAKMRNIKIERDAQKARDTLYSYNPADEHFFIVLVPNGDFNMNQIKTGVSDFNSTSFKLKDLKVSSTFLDVKTQTILVKSFPNKQEAKSYYIAYQVDKNHVKEFNTKFEYFIISAKNFSKLFISKDLVKYKEFFGKYYVN